MSVAIVAVVVGLAAELVVVAAAAAVAVEPVVVLVVDDAIVVALVAIAVDCVDCLIESSIVVDVVAWNYLTCPILRLRHAKPNCNQHVIVHCYVAKDHWHWLN